MERMKDKIDGNENFQDKNFKIMLNCGGNSLKNNFSGMGIPT